MQHAGDDEDIHFQFGVPESVASEGSGSVYVQISAPDTYAWVGLGIGQGMSGAEIFLVYQDGEGNVTLSTREGTGHVMPQYAERDNVELLEGTGVVDGTIVANVRFNATDSLDLGGSNNWIAAWKSGDALNSTDVEEQIEIHDAKTGFEVNFEEATISADASPFSEDSEEEPSDNEGTDADDGDGDDTSGSNSMMLNNAHGIVMTVVFLALYPIGSSLIPLLGKWYFHATWQFVAYLLMWAGFSLGFVYSDRVGIFFDNAHTRIGVIVVALLGVQPIFGWIHHVHFRNHGKRGIISHVHIWYGRALLLVGIVDGGLGLQLSGNTRGSFLIAYCVVASIMVVGYLASIAFGHVRRRNKAKREAGTPKPEVTQRSD